MAAATEGFFSKRPIAALYDSEQPAAKVGVSWHKLRHTAASRRVMAGVDLVSVKDILGHRSIQTTLRYSYLEAQHLRNAVTAWKRGWNRDQNLDQGKYETRCCDATA